MGWIQPGDVQDVVNIGAAIVGLASLIVGGISVATKNKTDDKVAKGLKIAHNILSPLALGNQKKKVIKPKAEQGK